MTKKVLFFLRKYRLAYFFPQITRKNSAKFGVTRSSYSRMPSYEPAVFHTSYFILHILYYFAAKIL
jgi:hypothetical protein